MSSSLTFMELLPKIWVPAERACGSRFIAMQWEVGSRGRSIMTKEREDRSYAGTCVDLANKATNDDDKKHLLARAEALLGLADRVQRPLPEPDARSLHPELRAKLP
jgi:hypothetical protein